MSESFSSAYMPRSECDRTHQDQEKLCEQKHKSVDEKLDSALNWIRGLVAAVIVEILVIGTYTITGMVK